MTQEDAMTHIPERPALAEVSPVIATALHLCTPSCCTLVVAMR